MAHLYTGGAHISALCEAVSPFGGNAPDRQYLLHATRSFRCRNALPAYKGHYNLKKGRTHMAIFHCSIKIISRSGGRSAVACAAYRAGEKLYDKETGILQDYTRKGGVVFREILLPPDAPAYLKDRETLWNEVQLTESRKNAQLAREIEVAFPKEFGRDLQKICARDFINRNFVDKGMIADWALHDKGDGNPHAHIMLTVRGVDPDGKWIKKQKSVFANARDKNGIPVYDPDLPSYDPKNKAATAKYRIPDLDENGNQKVRIRKGKGSEKLWVRISIPANDWNDRTKAEEWRASWAACCNRYLSKDKKLDHRSYKRQGRDIEPTVHEGVTARKMERKGKLSERCEVNRNIKNRNRILEGIRDLTKEIKDYILEKVRPVIEGIRRSVSAAKGEGRYYRIDPVFGGRYRCSRERSERHRETAGRIDQIKRGIEETEREIESTNREIEITDRDIKNYIRKNEIYKRYLHRTDRRVEGREPIAVEPPDAKIVEADFPAPAVPGPEHMEPDPIMIEIHVPKAAEQKKPAPFTHRDYDHTEEKEYTPGL